MPPKACQRPVALICAVSPAFRKTPVGVAPQARTFRVTPPLGGGGALGGAPASGGGVTGGGAPSGQGMSGPSSCLPQLGCPGPPEPGGNCPGPRPVGGFCLGGPGSSPTVPAIGGEQATTSPATIPSHPRSIVSFR